MDLKPLRGYINDSIDIKIGMVGLRFSKLYGALNTVGCGKRSFQDLSEYYPSIEWDILQVCNIPTRENTTNCSS